MTNETHGMFVYFPWCLRTVDVLQTVSPCGVMFIFISVVLGWICRGRAVRAWFDECFAMHCKHDLYAPRSVDSGSQPYFMRALKVVFTTNLLWRWIFDPNVEVLVCMLLQCFSNSNIANKLPHPLRLSGKIDFDKYYTNRYFSSRTAPGKYIS